MVASTDEDGPGAARPPGRPKPLTLAQQRTLLDIARAAIARKLGRTGGLAPRVQDDALRAPRGAFVTLLRDGELRGCIGALYPSTPLDETVEDVAVQAATEDPRFPPLGAPELRQTELEVSVLTPMSPIAPEHVEVGVHGLMVARGRRRGVLLPQVPVQYGWDRERFLAETCRKAGLPADAWKDCETQLLAFTAQVFSDHSVAQASGYDGMAEDEDHGGLR